MHLKDTAALVRCTIDHQRGGNVTSRCRMPDLLLIIGHNQKAERFEVRFMWLRENAADASDTV
jgi:hypothetical protein